MKLAGDSCCNPPGHSATYGTHTMLDVQSDKVVDFTVVSVCEVKNSMLWKRKVLQKHLKALRRQE